MVSCWWVPVRKNAACYNNNFSKLQSKLGVNWSMLFISLWLIQSAKALLMPYQTFYINKGRNLWWCHQWFWGSRKWLWIRRRTLCDTNLGTQCRLIGNYVGLKWARALVLHMCISKHGYYWLWWWQGNCLIPNHYLRPGLLSNIYVKQEFSNMASDWLVDVRFGNLC